MLDVVATAETPSESLAPFHGEFEHTMQEIVDTVARVCGVKPSDILRNDCRARWVTEPRQLAMYLCWMPPYARYSSPRVGNFFGRDHTTVIAGRRAAASRLEGQGLWRTAYNRVMVELGHTDALLPMEVQFEPSDSLAPPLTHDQDPYLVNRARNKRAKIKAELEACKALCAAFQ